MCAVAAAELIIGVVTDALGLLALIAGEVVNTVFGLALTLSDADTVGLIILPLSLSIEDRTRFLKYA